MTILLLMFKCTDFSTICMSHVNHYCCSLNLYVKYVLNFKDKNEIRFVFMLLRSLRFCVCQSVFVEDNVIVPMMQTCMQECVY